MVCTFVDVVGRYVFNSPLPGALELTEIMMASLIFTILPVVSARSDHITVDLLVLPRSSMLRRIQNLAINVTSAIMLAVLAWQLWLHAADRSEEHTSELQSLMRISYAVFCLTKKQLATRNQKQK